MSSGFLLLNILICVLIDKFRQLSIQHFYSFYRA